HPRANSGDHQLVSGNRNRNIDQRGRYNCPRYLGTRASGVSQRNESTHAVADHKDGLHSSTRLYGADHLREVFVIFTKTLDVTRYAIREPVTAVIVSGD